MRVDMYMYFNSIQLQGRSTDGMDSLHNSMFNFPFNKQIASLQQQQHK